MGNFLKSLNTSHNHKHQQFFNLFSTISLTKLNEYYAVFKSISETYSIDNEEFGQVLGSTDSSINDLFQCLDTDHNLLIDGLELFSAFGLLSPNIEFTDKIKFVFKLFDFNQLRSLSRTDIQFLILSCCNAVSKMFLTPSYQESFVQLFVREEFTKEERVNISQMLKWAHKSQSVSTFFRLIHHPFDRDSPPSLSQKIYLTLPPPWKLSSAILASVNSDQERLIDKGYKSLREVEEEETESQVEGCDVNPTPNWIFGIRYKDVKQFLEVQENELIYFVGRIVVLYDILSHKQRFYEGHLHQIISIAADHSLCASGEYHQVPEIKVWNRTNLQTLNTLRGHTQGVHLLLFLPGYLISCGCHQESPVLIHSLETGQSLFSTYCEWPAVDVARLQNFTSKPSQEFVIGNIYGIDHFSVEAKKQGISVTVTKLRELEGKSRLTCVNFLMLNSTFQRLSDYDSRVQKVLLAGYQNGDVCVWSLALCQKEFTFSQESSKVLRIISTHNALYIVSNSSFIRIYDLNISQPNNVSTIDFTQINQELSSYDLFDIKHTSRGLLAITQDADILFLKDYQGTLMPSLSNLSHQQYPALRVADILHIEGPVNCQKLIKKEEEECLYIVQGKRIRGIDMRSHSFVREWNVGRAITSFDAMVMRNGNLLIIAAAHIHPDQTLLCSFTDLSENSSRQILQGEVLTLILQPDENPSYCVVLASTRNAIYKYSYTRGTFTKATYLSLHNISPRLSCLDPTRFVLSTKDNTLQVIIINKQQQQMHIQAMEDNSIHLMTPLKIFFHLSTLSESREVLTGIIGRRIKALIASRWDGTIDLWSCYDQLLTNSPVTLRGHTSAVADLCLSQDQRFLISAGSKDGMIAEWRIGLSKESKSATIGWQVRQEVEQRPLDACALRKIEFCKFNNDVLSEVYDQHLPISGLKHQSIRRLFRATLNDWKTSHRSTQPTLHLKLDFAFGIETFHKNHTVLGLNEPKRILYFTGKLIVVYNPSLNSQTFYRGHRFKVTCLALLPDKARAVSGEAAYCPVLNIWTIATLETVRAISTAHHWGILELAVQGSILLSYGFRQKPLEDEEGQHFLYSFQVHDFQSGHSLAYSKQKNFVYALTLNPSNPLRFAVCTENKVSFMEAIANTIVRLNVCYIPQDTPTACIYYQTPADTRSSSSLPDLLVGTKSGAIGIVSRERYWYTFQKGQKNGRQVNCLLAVEDQHQTLIFASSEDNLLRVWNHTFEERLRVNLLKEEQGEESKKVGTGIEIIQNNRSLQSLCLLDCKQMRVLGGTRNGEIVQLMLRKPVGKKEVEDKSIVSITRFSSCDGVKGRGKVLLAHHPRFDVIVTLGEDQIVMFWDCDRRKLLHTSELGLDREKTNPTALRFSHNGDYLIVGFSDGLLVFLDSKMSKAMQGKGDEKYSQPSLKTLVKQKGEDGWTVVGIEISQGGQFMAVSYHRLMQKKSLAEVKIFANKANAHKVHRPNKFENQKVYELHSTVDNPHLDHVYHTALGGVCGFAVVSMIFADYEGSHYLLMFFQLLDQHQNRVLASQGEEDLKYKIRHVNNKTDSANSSSLNELIRWRKPHLHNALSSHYLIHNQSLEALPPNNHLRLPQLTAADLLEGHLVLASENGDIHLIGTPLVEMGGIASTVPAHSCKISQMEHNHDRSVLYTAGQYDHSVLRWIVEPNLNPSPQHHDDPIDLFAEIPHPQSLSNRLAKYHQNFIGSTPPQPTLSHQIRLHDVVGRRAYGLRNNLKIDNRGRLVYHSGQAVVVADVQGNCKQFLYARRKMVEEVSTIQMSLDGELLVAAYGGVKAAILVWGLSSKLLLSEIHLEDIVQVIYMALSNNNARLVLYGLRGKDAQGCVLLIDLFNQTVVATTTYLHKQNWYIKAISFAPNSQDRFLTCGVQPVKSWHLQSGHLTYTSLLSPDSNRIHTCLTFAQDYLITGTDDGQLVLWKEEPLTFSAHQQMVTCLAVTRQYQECLYIASGSQASLQGDNYQIILWVFINGQLKQLQQISARRDPLSTVGLGGRETSRYESDLQVQSLYFSHQELIIGLLKGDIYRYTSNWQQSKEEAGECQLMMTFEDGESTQSLFFTHNDEQLVDISEHGLLRIWNFPEIELVWSRHFQAEVIEMVYNHHYDLVILGFRRQLRFLRWGEERSSLEEMEERAIQFNFLMHLVLSQSQQLLALGIQNNSDKSHLIEVYDVGLKELRLKFRMRFDSPIDYVDFNRVSGQKSFILIKTHHRLELYDLNSLTEVSHELAFKLDWLGYGLLVADKTKRARELHRQMSGEGLTIKRIAQVGKGVLIADSSGGVYLFKEGELIGRSKLNMSGADCAGLSLSGRWCGIASRLDRNIVILELLGI